MKSDLTSKYITKFGIFRYLEELRPIARTNRKHPTNAESIFWNVILRNDKTGYRFLRQKPLDRFILDFYCSKLLLAVEIDGNSYIKKVHLDYERDKYLQNLGVKTIRYTNKQVTSDIKNVSWDLLEQINKRKIELNVPT